VGVKHWLLRKDRNLQVLRNKVVRKIFGPKKYEESYIGYYIPKNFLICEGERLSS
jgi:hypothetical protein